jgi:agmatine deiminase
MFVPEPQVPADLGLAMPAEWGEHARCWMALPTSLSCWGPHRAAARAAHARLARTIARFEPVTLLLRPEDRAEAEVLYGEDVELREAAIDDAWVRDTGPSFLLGPGGVLAGVHWRFNNYGNKEGLAPADYAADQRIAARILELAGAQRHGAPLVLEGGSIHVDGEGTLLTSEQCLLNRNRNPDLDRASIESLLMGYLGVERVIWLGQGLQDDDTDGHVDNLACFARPGVVVALSCHDPDDANHAPLQDNLARLRAARDAAGRSLEVIEIEQPRPRPHPDGRRRLAMSYVNFYLPNGGVVVPSFDDPERDVAALHTLQAVFPEREVVSVPGLDLIVGGGNAHCLTQQQPRAGGSEE